MARRAREFALERWRWQDMQSYMLLMILEVSLSSILVAWFSDHSYYQYQRMLASDRGALDILEIQDDVHAQWKKDRTWS